jgi:hypothetical protein
MQRVADHDPAYGVPPCKPRKRTQVVARVPLPFERHDRLCGEAQLVRDGDADAPVTDVEGEVSGVESSFQLLAPSF